MRKSVYLLLLTLVVALGSCKDAKKEDLPPSKMKQVMMIHDEVMPKMTTLGKLVAELNTVADSTEAGLKYDEAKKDLQTAHKSMMDWMQNFGNRFTSDEIMNGAPLTEQKQQWLAEEEEHIRKVQQQFDTSIENAKKILGKE
ncbi:hypothetical protein U1E44_14050 [Arenibacter sp. GZD96]|uniref:hypothetical protein n=1 Tax=Aurantibrevibacter litoralis TaxID=3106030 RepID=UPI002AFDD1A9|nr:hypothetical protein [Arenibacter sp. GZD-96]MEA1787220.1 hypothetical protein [Arenibacter sp. GZD-96]